MLNKYAMYGAHSLYKLGLIMFRLPYDMFVGSLFYGGIKVGNIAIASGLAQCLEHYNVIDRSENAVESYAINTTSAISEPAFSMYDFMQDHAYELRDGAIFSATVMPFFPSDVVDYLEHYEGYLALPTIDLMEGSFIAKLHNIYDNIHVSAHIMEAFIDPYYHILYLREDPMENFHASIQDIKNHINFVMEFYVHGALNIAEYTLNFLNAEGHEVILRDL